tara:strand:+ start:313 stop:453 length:141 start_codon:yes stop_codon:yes gene_type:complete
MTLEILVELVEVDLVDLTEQITPVVVAVEEVKILLMRQVVVMADLV